MRAGGAIVAGVACLSARHASGWIARVPGAGTGFKTAERQRASSGYCRRAYNYPTATRAAATTVTRKATATTRAAWSSSSSSLFSLRRRKSKDSAHLEVSSVSPPKTTRTRLEATAVSTTAAAAAAATAASSSPFAKSPIFGIGHFSSSAPVIPSVHRDIKGNKNDPSSRNATTTAASATRTPGFSSELESSSRKPWVGRLTLATVACLYGTNYSAVKFVGGLLETSNFLALRFGLASLVLLPFLRGVSAEVWKAGAEVGVYATLGYWGQAWAMRTLPASQLALVGCLAVVMVPLFDHLSDRRKASATTIAAAALACGGAALLQTAGGDVAGAGGGTDVTIWENLLVLSQPFFFGMTTWRMEAHVSRHPGQATALTASQVLVVGVCSIAWAVLGGDWPSGLPEALANPIADPWALGVLVWTSLVTTALTLFLETTALESVSASEATVIYSLDPLVGAGIASSVLGEPFGPTTAVGASLVLGGCLCSSLGRVDDDDDDETA